MTTLRSEQAFLDGAVRLVPCSVARRQTPFTREELNAGYWPPIPITVVAGVVVGNTLARLCALHTTNLKMCAELPK